MLVPLPFHRDGAGLLGPAPAAVLPAEAPPHPDRSAGAGPQPRCSRIEGPEIAAAELQRGDRFAARTGCDPRGLAPPHRLWRSVLRRIRAGREVTEGADREQLRDCRQLV